MQSAALEVDAVDDVSAPARAALSFSDKAEEPYVQIGRQTVENAESASNPADINFVGFNQDQTWLAIGTVDGFSIFDMETFSLMFQEEYGPVMQIEMLFRATLIALVGVGSTANSKLTMWNMQDRCEVCERSFDGRIQAVRMNHRRIVVLLPSAVYVFDLKCMDCVYTFERPAAPWMNASLCWLCAAPERSYLALPLAVKAGLLSVVDVVSLKTVGKVVAHRSPLQAMCMNPTGQLLATASVKGTVVRVFSLPSMEVLCLFRRGASPCQIYHLSFSGDSDFLVVSAASGTAHIFRTPEHVLGDLPSEAEAGVQEGRVEHARGAGKLDLTAFASPRSTTDEVDPQDETFDGSIEDEWNIVDDKPERLLELHAGVPLYSGAQGGGNAGANARMKAMQALTTYSEYAAESATRYAKSLLHQLLPDQYRDIVDAEWAFAWVNVEESDRTTDLARQSPAVSKAEGLLLNAVKESFQDRVVHGSFAACSRNSRSVRAEVVIATRLGAARVYEWNPTVGGEGVLRKALYLKLS
mmetsp:Transcript_6453/g.15687  ORF Transcript_6453/g.15687 Transcript_6453/m.15687 type:complete len:526 (+) Transcript_6453:1-1578(+)